MASGGTVSVHHLAYGVWWDSQCSPFGIWRLVGQSVFTIWLMASGGTVSVHHLAYGVWWDSQCSPFGIWRLVGQSVFTIWLMASGGTVSVHHLAYGVWWDSQCSPFGIWRLVGQSVFTIWLADQHWRQFYLDGASTYFCTLGTEHLQQVTQNTQFQPAGDFIFYRWSKDRLGAVVPAGRSRL